MARVRLGSVAVVLFVLGAPPPALADSSVLSTRLQELATPELRDASRADQADAVSLVATGAGSLARAGSDLIVEIRTVGRARELAAAGAEIVHVSEEYDTVTAAVDERELHSIAAVRGVEYVGEVVRPMTGSIDTGPRNAGAINTCAPGVVSEGDAQLNGDDARALFDIDGAGVTVGVLSDSYDTKPSASTHAAQDIASGNLPGPGNPCGRTTPVAVLDDSAGAQSDEGRAMLQIVHDLAPGASLAFATAYTGPTAYADNIRALATAGADILADDVGYFGEPMYQDGIIAKAINDVTAQGVAHFSMAYNNNGTGLNSFEAPEGYRSTSCPAVVLADRAGASNSCMDFDPGAGFDNTFNVDVDANDTLRLDLSWAEPAYGITDDFDIYVLDPGDNSVDIAGKIDNLASGTANDYGSVNTGSGGARQIVIRRYAGTGTPRLKFVSIDNGADTINSTQSVSSPDIQGPTIMGHSGAAAAQTVAAVPYFNSNTVESFSSRGPVTSIFEPVNGTVPSPAYSAPQVLTKPDVAATDGGITSFFGGGNRFFGTSAAAPHAAAVGALQLSANPALSVTDIFNAQKGTARPVGLLGPFDVGAGLIDAQQAIAANPTPPPTLSITGAPTGTITNRTPAFTFAVGGRTKTVTCSFDGGAATPCSSPYSAPSLSDGPHTLTVVATDFFGQPASDSASFSVDATPPAVTISGPEGSIRDTRPTFSFTAEAGATVACSLDDGAPSFAPCTPGVAVQPSSPLSEGSHAFRVRATDPLGNTGTTVRSFTVDTTAPGLEVTSGPAGTVADRRPSFGFSGAPDATLRCAIDSDDLGPCSGAGSHQPATPLGDGPHEFRVEATDAAGNSTARTRAFAIDTTPPPAPAITKAPKQRSKSNKATFEFTSSDAASFNCSLDTKAFFPCTSPTSVTVAKAKRKPRTHSFSIEAVDMLGNTSPLTTYRWAVKKKRR